MKKAGTRNKSDARHVLFKIETVVSSVLEVTILFPLNRKLMTATRQQRSTYIISRTVESDNPADTWCFGPNFVMDHFTGHMCSISGYDKKISSTEIYIDTGLTLWANPATGRPHLLQVNQWLDMRHILNHTLANPKQYRAFGVSWCDDAWDKHRSFGIQCENPDLLTLFQMTGSTALFMTKTRTDDEI